MGAFSKDNQMFVHNASSEKFWVFVGPNTDWQLADLGFEAGGTLASIIYSSAGLKGSYGKVGKAVGVVMTTYRTLALAFKIIGIIKNIGKLASFPSAFGKIKDDEAQFKTLRDQDEVTLREILKKKFDPIEPGQTERVFWGTVQDKWAKPSGIASAFGAGDVAMLVVSDSLRFVAQFASNSDHSWIIRNEGVVRSRYGNLLESLETEGYYRFSTLPEISELNERCRVMRPGDCLVSPNGQWAFTLQRDGNAVVYRAEDNRGGFYTLTNGKEVDRLELQEDGNLVLYGKDGGVLRATSKGKVPQGDSVGRKLVLPDNGNLSLLNDKGVAIWDVVHLAALMWT